MSRLFDARGVAANPAFFFCRWVGVATIVGMCLAVPLVAGSGTAVAQTKLSELSDAEKQKMQEFLKAGKEEYEKGNFEAAIPFLKKAHEIFPKPAFHYRIALAYERSGQPKKALEYYRNFLEEKPDTDKRGQVEKTIARLEKRMAEASRATIRVESSPSGAEVSIGAGSNQTRGTTPLEMRVEPGKVELVLQKEGRRTISESVRVEAGKSYEYNYTLPPAETAGTRGVRPLPMALAGGGLAAIAAAGIYDLAAKCTVNRDVATGTSNPDREPCFYQHEYRRRVTVVGTMSGLGAAALGTAIYLWAADGFVHEKASPKASSSGISSRHPSLRLRLSLQSVQIGVSGSF